MRVYVCIDMTLRPSLLHHDSACLPRLLLANLYEGGNDPVDHSPPRIDLFVFVSNSFDTFFLFMWPSCRPQLPYEEISFLSFLS